jgi:hypothetical protein
LPEGEHPEHTYSFDYGNTHFVTLDTNPVELPGQLGAERIEALIDFVAADLQASQAQWKIVYAHHPIMGTAKSYDDPNSLYFQRMLSRLVAAGADLLMVGHSHTYSWTHAVTGFEDRNQDGVIAADEVNFVPDTNRMYPKGAGLIQLVAGVGGRRLTADPYGDPVFASTYSLSDSTGPIEFGFAQVDVTQHRLTVSYISAETGRIVGDTNGNWRVDDDEPLFGRFQIVDAAVTRGDLNGDGALRDADIDLLAAALRAGDDHPQYDLNDDTANNAADYAVMVDSIVGASRGDANLDGVFGSSDLESVFRAGKYERPHSLPAMWADGDWNADGLFTSADLVLAFQLGSFRD